MTAKLLRDPLLASFRTALAAAYGDRIERVVLFGSRARSDHQPDSDYDIAVFIKDPGTFGKDAGRLAKVTTENSVEYGRGDFSDAVSRRHLPGAQYLYARAAEGQPGPVKATTLHLTGVG